MLEIQAEFLATFLPEYFQRCRSHGIRYLAMFGNDDLGCHWLEWRRLVDEHAHVDELSASWHDLGHDIIIRGCPYVPDVPFRLKDWILRDDEDSASPQQLAQPVLSTPTGLQVIEDVQQFLRSRPTLEEHLSSIASEIDGRDMQQAVLVGHSPPADTGLAVIGDGTDVGSKATTRWIARNQPLLTLHGHIHESPDVSGIHMFRLGRTVCHNPGQSVPRYVTASVITVDETSVNIERMLLPPSNERE